MTYSDKAREIAEAKALLSFIPLSDFDRDVLENRVAKSLERVGNEREAIGYEKGKEEAANYCDYTWKSDGSAYAKAIRALPLPPKGK